MIPISRRNSQRERKQAERSRRIVERILPKTAVTAATFSMSFQGGFRSASPAFGEAPNPAGETRVLPFLPEHNDVLPGQCGNCLRPFERLRGHLFADLS